MNRLKKLSVECVSGALLGKTQRSRPQINSFLSDTYLVEDLALKWLRE